MSGPVSVGRDLSFPRELSPPFSDSQQRAEPGAEGTGGAPRRFGLWFGQPWLKPTTPRRRRLDKSLPRDGDTPGGKTDGPLPS